MKTVMIETPATNTPIAVGYKYENLLEITFVSANKSVVFGKSKDGGTMFQISATTDDQGEEVIVRAFKSSGAECGGRAMHYTMYHGIYAEKGVLHVKESTQQLTSRELKVGDVVVGASTGNNYTIEHISKNGGLLTRSWHGADVFFKSGELHMLKGVKLVGDKL